MNARIRSEPHAVLAGLLRGREEQLEDPRETSSPELVARIHEACAVFGYGYGSPLADVKAHLDKAIRAYRVVQYRRPSLQALSTPHGGEYVDYWIGTSNVTLRYLYWALTLSDVEEARALALETWDPAPPAVPEVFPVFRVAYALRDVVLDRPGALGELARIEKASKSESLQASALAAIVRSDSEASIKSLDELARTHRRAAGREALLEHRLVCIPAAGLASLALDRGVIGRDQLPTGVDCFPTELVLDGRP